MNTLKTSLAAGFLAVAATGCDNSLNDVVFVCTDTGSFTRHVVRENDSTVTLSFRVGKDEILLDKMVGKKFLPEMIERAKKECAAPNIK